MRKTPAASVRRTHMRLVGDCQPPLPLPHSQSKGATDPPVRVRGPSWRHAKRVGAILPPSVHSSLSRRRGRPLHESRPGSGVSSCCCHVSALVEGLEGGRGGHGGGRHEELGVAKHEVAHHGLVRREVAAGALAGVACRVYEGEKGEKGERGKRVRSCLVVVVVVRGREGRVRSGAT